MIDTLLNHRSIRKYKDQAIENDKLDKILEAGVRASTTGNMQLYSIVVTKDEEVKKELAPTHFNQPMTTQAPVVVTVCADLNRFNKWCEARDAEPGYDNFLWFYNASIDALLAAQNICAAAEDFGMGICYLGTTTYNADKIIDILNLPKYVVPVTTITIGYPDESPELTDRLPLEAVVHNEKYTDYTPESINELYKIKEGLELTKKLIEENETQNLAQVFTEKRYKKADNEFFSEKFFEVVNKQGFLK